MQSKTKTYQENKADDKRHYRKERRKMSNVSLIDGHIDEPKKQTNYDRIRNMSVDELAKFISINGSNGQV